MPDARFSRHISLVFVLLSSSGLPGEIAGRPLLTPVDSFRGTPFTHATSLAISEDGDSLYTTGSSGASRSLSLFRRTSDDQWRLSASYLNGESDQVGSATGSVILSRDQRHLFVATFEPAGVAVFERDFASGLLTKIQALNAGENGLPIDLAPRAIAESPSGSAVYIGFETAGKQAILVFSRELSGHLTLVQTAGGPAPPTHTSYSLSNLVVSEDGRQLYTLGYPVVSTFDTIDPQSGLLVWRRHRELLADDSMGMSYSSKAVMTPDGRGLYVQGRNGCYNSCSLAGLAMLSREPVTGAVDFLGHAEGSVLGSGSEVFVSPEGTNIYLTDSDDSSARITTYSRVDGGPMLERRSSLVNEGESGYTYIQDLVFDREGAEIIASGFANRPFARLDRDLDDGGLEYRPVSTFSADGMVGLSGITTVNGSNRLYGTGSRSGSIAAFEWNDSSGRLDPSSATYLHEVFSSLSILNWPYRIQSGGPEGAFLYVLTDHGGLAVLTPEADGSLTGLSVFDPGTEISGITAFSTSADGKNAYLFGNAGIIVLEQHPLGDLEPVQTVSTAENYRAAVVSPDGLQLYALATLGCPTCHFILTFDRDPESGVLSLREQVTGIGDVPFETPRSMVITPDGRNLYLGSFENEAATIVVLARDRSSGDLTLVEVVGHSEPDVGPWFRNIELAISPDGRNLYSILTPSDALQVFERQSSDGTLAFVQQLDSTHLGSNIDNPAGLAVSEDSQLVFLSSASTNSLTALSRRCLTSERSSCFGSDRFRVDIGWRDFDDNIGSARALDTSNDTSRLYWFFDRDNWEMLVKVLDGCAINDRFWVYAASGTDVETTIEVTDTWTGQQRSYGNLLGQPAAALTDSSAFATCHSEPPLFSAGSAPSTAPPSLQSKQTCDGDRPGSCALDRFDIEIEWRDFDGNIGVGTPVAIESSSSSVFWFFDQHNWEMIVKVLDGCSVNDRFWVFAAASTDVETTLTVTDRTTGEQRRYTNPLGHPARALTDTAAFSSCRP